MADLLARTTSFTNTSKPKLETAIWTAKLMLLSIGTLSTFHLFKVAVIPCLFDFALSILPRALTAVRTCLSPPYIYIIVNFIIISIAATSSLHHSKPSVPDKAGSRGDEEESIAVHRQDVRLAKSESADVISQDVASFFSTDAAAVVGGDISDSEAEVVVVKHELTSSDEFSYSENSPPEDESDSYDDTLDGTWKAIMDGKGTVKKPLLKKSDTWNATRAPPPPLGEVSNYLPRSEMRKSETFNDRVSSLRTGGGLRRETVLSSEDSLNERVEAFINKFNNDMRIERQQSDMRYINMMKRAAAT